MNLSLTQVLIATFCIMAVTFIERAFPFILFSKKTPPAIIRFIEKYIPPMVMAALLVYCFKDISFNYVSGYLPYIICVLAAIMLHLWKRNSLISIFGSTILYMILIRIM